MKMRKDDYTIFDLNKTGDMIVLAFYSGMCMKWPDTIHDEKTDETYKFASNEVLEDWMVGNYSGCAKYILIE